MSTHPDELRQPDDEIGREQEYVSMLYGRLDDMREQATRRLTDELRTGGGTLQDRSQRDSAVRMYADQVEQFSAVEQGLAEIGLKLLHLQADGARRATDLQCGGGEAASVEDRRERGEHGDIHKGFSLIV